MQNPYNTYATQKILMASPAELTLMLYDGVIKFCNIAKIAIEEKEIEKCHKNILRAQAIIEELRVTLDRQYPVAEDFDRVYVYILSKLFEANIKKDTEILDEAIKQTKVMRETWLEVMKTA